MDLHTTESDRLINLWGDSVMVESSLKLNLDSDSNT